MSQSIEIKTADGSAEAHLFSPAKAGGTAGVILYMDAFGLRPALDEMAERLAAQGYYVLVPDLFYRSGNGPFDTNAFSDPDKRAAIMKMLGETTQAMTAADTGAFIDALTSA